MKKGLFALAVVALIVAAAPDAAADHCYRCINFTRCGPAVTGGKPVCDDSSGTCVFQGTTCTGPHPLIEVAQPLAAQMTVVSVERVDEPGAPTDETRVASLETAQPKTAER